MENWLINRKHPENSVLLHFGAILAYFLVTTFLFSANFDNKVALVRQMVFFGTDIFYFYFVAYYLFPTFFDKKKYFKHFSIGTIMYGILVYFRGYVAINSIYFDKIASGYVKPQLVWLIASFTLFGSMAVATVFRLIINYMRQVEKEEKLEKEKLIAEMNFLKAQINPHFLFNSLNNIYGLALIESKKTPEMVLKLSQFLRHNLYDGKAAKVSLGEEMKYIENYIELISLKYEQPLNIEFNINEIDPKVKIEPLLFINFVENAFKHSQVESGVGVIRIMCKTTKNDLFFYCGNSKPINPGKKDSVGGIGLENNRKRLELVYPNAHTMEIIETDETFTVNLNIKLRP
ncbi:MAG: histidine kinase [Bacteroidetes bacterium]|nr:histidine kinase [Bacteroidota bacterium]